MSLGAIDILIIAASLVLVVVVGLRAGRAQDQSSRSYFLASSRMPWWLIGAAFVATSVSSEQIVGTVGVAYQHGMGVANWEWFTLPAYTLLVLVFIPMYLKNRIATVPEFLARRYGPLCADIYSWVMLAAYIFVFLVPVLYGGSLAFSQLTGWNFYAVLWAIVILIAVYTCKGGLASVMWADGVQCLLLVGGGVVLFFVALAKIPGGWSAMEAARPERFHLHCSTNDPLAPLAGLLAGISTVMIFYQAANQVMIQRVLSARSLWDGLMGIVWAGFINLFRPLITCFLGFVVFHWVQEMHQSPEALGQLAKNSDLTFPFALQTFAPSWGLRGLILAGFLAAVMSALSALANSTATLFSLEVYRKVFSRNASERTLVRVGQAGSLVALIVAALLAPRVASLGGIFKYFQTGVTYVATPFATVMLLGIFWWRTNYPSALFGLIGGFAIHLGLGIGLPIWLNHVYAGEPTGWIRNWVYLSANDGGGQTLHVHWLYLAFLAQLLIVLGMVIVARFTPPPDRAAIASFLWSPRWLREFGATGPRPWYQSVPLWFGLYAAIWCGLYWRFW
jgi:SSS family solute:Na+ symporter